MLLLLLAKKQVPNGDGTTNNNNNRTIQDMDRACRLSSLTTPSVASASWVEWTKHQERGPANISWPFGNIQNHMADTMTPTGPTRQRHHSRGQCYCFDHLDFLSSVRKRRDGMSVSCGGQQEVVNQIETAAASLVVESGVILAGETPFMT